MVENQETEADVQTLVVDDSPKMRTLLAGVVTLSAEAEDIPVTSLDINAVFTSDINIENINAAVLAQMQISLKAASLAAIVINDPKNVKFYSVVINNIIGLGIMTDAQWEAQVTLPA